MRSVKEGWTEVPGILLHYDGQRTFQFTYSISWSGGVGISMSKRSSKEPAREPERSGISSYRRIDIRGSYKLREPLE